MLPLLGYGLSDWLMIYFIHQICTKHEERKYLLMLSDIKIKVHFLKPEFPISDFDCYKLSNFLSESQDKLIEFKE